MLNPIHEAKFEAVQALIDEQDYEGAQVILRDMDDPKARALEQRLKVLQSKPRSDTRHLLIATAAFAIGGLALIITLIGFIEPRMDDAVRLIAAILAVGGFLVAYVVNKLGKR